MSSGGVNVFANAFDYHFVMGSAACVSYMLQIRTLEVEEIFIKTLSPSLFLSGCSICSPFILLLCRRSFPPK